MATGTTRLYAPGSANIQKVDPRLVDIAQRAAAQFPYPVRITPSGGFNARRGGTKNHPGGYALDFQIQDPATGQWLGNYQNPETFRVYEQFAQTMRQIQTQEYPELNDTFRFGGYFGGRYGFDQMHVDINPKMRGAMSNGSWEYGLGRTKTGQAVALPAKWKGVETVGLNVAPPSLPAPPDAQSAIADLVDPGGGTLVPDMPSPLMAFGPPVPAPPIDDMLTGASADEVLAGGPRPNPRRQPIDEALTGMSPEQVLAGGPRMDPRRVPIDPDLTGRSPADVLGAGPNLSPRALAQIDRLNTAMVPRPRPEGRWLEGAGGAPDAGAVPNPPMRPEPFPSLFPPRPEGPASGMPRAPWEPTVAGRPEGPPPSGMPPAPPAPRLMTDGGQELYGPGNAAGRSRYNTYQYMQDFDRRMAEDLAASESRDLAFDEGRRRAEMEALQPPYRAPPPQTMGERFDSVAGDRSNAGQIFGLPDLNGASFPPPDPVIGTAEAGSTTGEFFTPAPPMPPDTLAGRFDDAFAPAPPTAMDGINSVFGAPPASAGVPNLAIPFAEVPGFDMGRFADAPPVPSPGDLFGSAPAEAATIASPLPKPAGPPSISMADFDSRFGGGTVVTPPVPRPGQPGVSLGTMPTPADAMDIRPPDMGGPAFTPRPSLPAPPSPAPRQRNPGAERNGPKLGGIAGRVLGGLLGGPIGALGGGFLGRGLLNGGGGFGFGQPATYNWTTGGTAPYGSGTTTWQGGTSNALGGSNALSWQGSGGQTVTVVQDPWSGGYYGPTVSGGGLY